MAKRTGLATASTAERRWHRRRRRANQARAMWAARRAYLAALGFDGVLELVSYAGLEVPIKAYAAPLAAPPSAH